MEVPPGRHIIRSVTITVVIVVLGHFSFCAGKLRG